MGNVCTGTHSAEFLRWVGHYFPIYPGANLREDWPNDQPSKEMNWLEVSKISIYLDLPSTIKLSVLAATWTCQDLAGPVQMVFGASTWICCIPIRQRFCDARTSGAVFGTPTSKKINCCFWRAEDCSRFPRFPAKSRVGGWHLTSQHWQQRLPDDHEGICAQGSSLTERCIGAWLCQSIFDIIADLPAGWACPPRTASNRDEATAQEPGRMTELQDAENQQKKKCSTPRFNLTTVE